MELERRKNKKWFWNPVYGKSYGMGYHHRTSPHLLDAKWVDATYLGTIGNKRMFFREDHGKVFVYAANAGDSAVWYGGDDEPYVPAFRAWPEGELFGRERDYVLSVLKQKRTF